MISLRSAVSIVLLVLTATGCFSLAPICCAFGVAPVSLSARWSFENCAEPLCGFVVLAGRAERVAEVHPGEHSMAIASGTTVESPVGIAVNDRGSEQLSLLANCDATATLSATEIMVTGGRELPVGATLVAPSHWSRIAVTFRMGPGPATRSSEECPVAMNTDQLISNSTVRALQFTVSGTGRCVIDDVGFFGSQFVPGAQRDAGRDAGSITVDAGRPDARADVLNVPADTAPSLAGRPCTTNADCGSQLTCDTTVPGGICTGPCVNTANQATEAAMCGGPGSTCLRRGDTANDGLCTRSCVALQMMSGCNANQVCTGWWLTHARGPDRPGCAFFCHADAQCATGQRCNRSGECAVMLAPDTNQPDGTPCDPTRDVLAMPSTQCRGVCFRVGSAMPAQGICASLIDIANPPMGELGCPDGDPAVQPIAHGAGVGTSDNLALCIFRTCACDDDCPAPLQCVISSMEAGGFCRYPNILTGEHGTPCSMTDGGDARPGATDATTSDADASESFDASLSDAAAITDSAEGFDAIHDD